MAGPYYVDIGAPGAWNGRTGLDTGANLWLGLSGFQKAADTAAANEIVYIKGTGDVSKLKSFTCINLVDVFVAGEGVTWDVGASTGVISEVSTGSPTVIEVLTGTLANGDNLVGTTSGATADVNAVPAALGVAINTNNGAANTGYIRFIGTNSSWTVDDTRAVFDMNSAVDHVITVTGSDYIWLQNIEAREAGTAKHGFTFASETANNVLINCSAVSNASRGFNMTSSRAYVLWRCVAYSNVYNGFETGITPFTMIGCCSRDNSNYGFQGGNVGDTFLNCIAHGNTLRGFNPVLSTAILNCVSDANGTYGIQSAGHVLLVGNRITNHSGTGDIGINCSSLTTITAFNYLENNAGDNIQNATLHYNIAEEGGTTNSNREDQSDTDYGYVDSANHDFSTDYTDGTDPTLRRTAITIPWT